MAVWSEEVHTINVGSGLYTAELASSIPDGYVPEAYNLVATGETLENRQGFVQTTINFKENGPSFGHHARFYELVQFNADYPILAFSWGTELHFIRSSQALTSGLISGDGYMMVDPGVGDIYSLCQYNDRTYFSTPLGIYVITDYDWSADSITFANVPGGPPNIFGLFSFKDRLWGNLGDKLYFTEVASITSPYPETWAIATNNLPIRSDRGLGSIQGVVPLGNRLIIFTQAGAFSLLVEGTPASWIKKTLDIKSSSTRASSSFEAQGIVYYVNTTGVYATNGLSTAKISGVIDDKFIKPNTSLRHSIHYIDDGMLLCISRHFKDALGTERIDSASTELLYTKLDPIAWTQWGIEGTEDYPSDFDAGNHRLCEIQSIASGVNTFLSESPVTLMLCAVGFSSVASPQNLAYQLVLYDGHENDFWVWDGDSYERITDSVKLNVVTRFSDSGTVHKLKKAKYGYLEAYVSDENHDLTTKFVIDGTGGFVDIYNVTEESVGDAVNLIKIPAEFPYRRIAAVLASYLQSTDSQMKIKGFHIIEHTSRNETEDVR